MPGLYRDQGVVLRTIKLGEADRIVTVMTQGTGKVRAVAKGVRKSGSRFGARLEPTSHVALQCYRGRELDVVTQVETIDAWRPLRENYAALTHAVSMLEAVDQVAQEREPAPAIYRMLVGALRTMSESPSPVVTPGFFWKLLSLEGFHPHLDGCVRCTEETGPFLAFDLDEGGVLCATCGRLGGRRDRARGARVPRPAGRRGAAPGVGRPTRRRARARGRTAGHRRARVPQRAAPPLGEPALSRCKVRIAPFGSATTQGCRARSRSLTPSWPSSDLMDRVVNLAKRRGLVFPSSEIYGGFRSTWDYGPLGVLLKRNVKDAWWRAMVQERDDVVGLDTAILMAPKVWEASGHLATFTDPLVDCRNCKERFRADQLPDSGACPNCGAKDSFTEARNFNLMFKTHVGPVEDDAAAVATCGRRPPRASSSTSPTCRRRAARSRRSASRRSASRSATRSRPATSSSARASSSRWRWSSSCRPPTARVVRVLVRGALPLVRRPRHPRGHAPAPTP